jgi:UDP-perosamine 4-acetyltransferase
MSGNEVKKRIPVLVCGASSQAVVATDIFESGTEYVIHAYLDETERKYENDLVCGKPVCKNISDVVTVYESGISHAIIAIGNIGARVRLSKILKNIGFIFVNAIHPKAVISGRAELGHGIIIKSGATIDPLVNIGNHAYIGSCSTIGHDVVIGDYSNVVSGVNISGHSIVGSRTHIGTGASIKDRIVIGNDVLIGAGSVVTRKVPDSNLPKEFRPVLNQSLSHRMNEKD